MIGNKLRELRNQILEKIKSDKEEKQKKLEQEREKLFARYNEFLECIVNVCRSKIEEGVITISLLDNFRYFNRFREEEFIRMFNYKGEDIRQWAISEGFRVMYNHNDIVLELSWK